MHYTLADINHLREETYQQLIWGYGSVGRAMRSQCIGQGFESPYLHHLEPRSNPWFLFVCINGVAGIIVKTKPYEKIISYDWQTKPRENGKFVKKT